MTRPAARAPRTPALRLAHKAWQLLHQDSGLSATTAEQALARALANYPKLLLMDEPFGALDAETRWQMQELLLDVVSKDAMTVLIVTHDIDEALFLGDRIVFLSRHPGRVREVLQPPFKQGGRLTTKEALYDAPGYHEIEKHVMRMMREEGAGAPH